MAIGFVSLFLHNHAQNTEQKTDVQICTLTPNNYYQTEQNRIYVLIEKQVHHLRGLLKNWKDDSSMKLITNSKSDEHGIRPNTTCAADFGFLYRFGSFDSSIVGVSRHRLLHEDLVPMLRYLIRTHNSGDLKTDDGKSWGDAWQSAHWTAALGTAVWWCWQDLPLEIREGARRVIAHEAERIAHTVPPHQIKFDSKSEENAWNSQVLSVALLLMPNDNRYAQWEAALQQWALSSYLRPSDSTSSLVVDGRPLSQQFRGANIYNDFTLENHGFVHPDYMGAWILNAGNDLDYLMTGRKPFQSFLFNLSNIYNNQKRMLFPDGGYGYPNGQDWALFRNADWITCHATALSRFNDPGALYHLQCGLETAEKMQARNADGAIYAPGENYFPSSQPHLGYWLVQAWLVLHYANREIKPLAPKDGVDYFKDGKIIINRTPRAFHSVSWGAQTMIQLMNLGKDHIVSPDQRNGIGSITINDTLQRIKLKSINVKPYSQGFNAHLVLTHGHYVQADITCESKANGQLMITETLTALQDCQTDSIATLSFGILNNPNWVYETGSRHLQLGDEKHVVKSASGKNYQTVGRKAQVDDLVFTLSSQSSLVYKTASEINRSRFTDFLILNSVPQKKSWKAGAVISKQMLTITMQ